MTETLPEWAKVLSIVFLMGLPFLAGSIVLLLASIIFWRAMNSFDHHTTRLWHFQEELTEQVAAAADLEAYRYRKQEKRKEAERERKQQERKSGCVPPERDVSYDAS